MYIFFSRNKINYFLKMLQYYLYRKYIYVMYKFNNFQIGISRDSITISWNSAFTNKFQLYWHEFYGINTNNKRNLLPVDSKLHPVKKYPSILIQILLNRSVYT